MDFQVTIQRKKTKEIRIGAVKIGAGNPIAIQSMAKSPTKNYKEVIAQLKRLQGRGCAIARLAITDEEDIRAIKKIKRAVSLPLVADIHFNWRLAISAIKEGIDKIRLNPGNIYKKEELREIVTPALDYAVPIRVGLNSGSIPKIFRYNSKLTPSLKLVRAALDYLGILEELNFKNIVVSLKDSSVLGTIGAYRDISRVTNYPLHLGVTATGFSEAGRIKSAIALGILLEEGIGDTLRVSLTDTPEEEVKVARYILSSLGLVNAGPEIISCPTCGRTEVDIPGIVSELQKKLLTVHCQQSTRPTKLAVMGCVVNGPGEAEGADLAVAFGKGYGLIYRNGKPVRKVISSSVVKELIKELSLMRNAS